VCSSDLGGWLAQALQSNGMPALEAYRVVLVGYALAGLALVVCFLNLSPAVEVSAPAASSAPRILGLHKSRGVVLKLKVVRLDGQPITFPVALVRGLAAAFSVVVMFLGFLWIAWDKEKQGWHDKLAGTVVISTQNRPQPQSPQPEYDFAGGFGHGRGDLEADPGQR
jgi:hypothetical protein